MPTDNKLITKELESFKDLNIDGNAIEMDLNDDVWSATAPPPKGLYSFKFFMGQGGRKAVWTKEGDDSTLYIQATIELRVQDEGDWKDAAVYYNVDTRVFRGRKISTMAAVLVKLYGQEQLKKVKLTPKKQAELLDAALKKEPIRKGEIDWKGGFMSKDKKGEDSWNNVFAHYENFPDDPENKGQKQHVVTVTKDGQSYDVVARATVVRIYGKDEQPVVKTAAGGTKVKPVEVIEEVEEEAPKVKVASNKEANKKAAEVEQKEDEESMELLEL